MFSGKKSPTSVSEESSQLLSAALLPEDFERLEKEQALRTSPLKRKRLERDKDLKQSMSAPQASSGSSASTPEKIMARFIDGTIVTPERQTRYTVGKIIGHGEFAVVHLGTAQAPDNGSIAIKKRIRHEGSAHKEARESTKTAHKIYGYASFFCPAGHDHKQCNESQQPHYLILPYIPGKEPEDTVTDYLDAIIRKPNADSLAMYGVLRVFTALAEAYAQLVSKGVIHGDAHSGNIKVGLKSATRQLEAKVVDFDHSKEISTVIAEAKQASLSAETRASITSIAARTDVDSIGEIFDEIMKALIEKDLYGPEREGEDDRGLLADRFLDELKQLELLINQMSSKALEDRPDFSEVVTRLKNIYESAQAKFVRVDAADFTDAQITSAPVSVKHDLPGAGSEEADELEGSDTEPQAKRALF